MNILKRLFCKHKNKEMLRWHYTHGYNGMELCGHEVEGRKHNALYDAEVIRAIYGEIGK